MIPYDTLSPYPLPYDSLGNSTAVYPLDTIFPLTDSVPAAVIRSSLFAHHQLPVQHVGELARQACGTGGWYFVAITIAILLLVLLLRGAGVGIAELIHSTIDSRVCLRTIRDGNLTRPVAQTPIALVSLVPVVLVVFHYLQPNSLHPWRDILQYLLLLLIVYVLYFTRNGIIRLIGRAFDDGEATHLYLSSNYVYHLLYGVAAALFSFFICYAGEAGEVFFYILCGVIGILFVMRLFCGMRIILTNAKTSKLQLFYYLCSLEIVPVLVAVKLAVS